MDTINLESTITRSKELIASSMDDELVMMSIASGTYYGLNEVGAQIWSLIEQPKKVERICKELQSDYDVDAATCQTEVLNLLNEMATEKLLVID